MNVKAYAANAANMIGMIVAGIATMTLLSSASPMSVLSKTPSVVLERPAAVPQRGPPAGLGLGVAAAQRGDQQAEGRAASRARPGTPS